MDKKYYKKSTNLHLGGESLDISSPFVKFAREVGCKERGRTRGSKLEERK